MPYHIDEENSELAFEVREGNKLVIKIKSNIFSDSLELYLIKVGDNTEPTDKNVFSSLRVLKEIENLHDTILKEINSVTSGLWELKQDSQGNEYIATKYNVLTEGGLTTYGLGEQKLGTIYDGLPIDNDTIYWEEVEGSRVLKAKGSGGGSTGLDETKLWNVLGTPGDQQIDYSHLRSAFSQFSNEFVTINTEQEITALKHFTAGLSIGSAKKKIYEKDGVLYIDSNVAITGALTMYATDGQSVSSIYDGLPIDNDTIYWGTVEGSRVLKAKGGSSFDENAMWSALSGSSNNQINKSHLTTALDGYATRNWVIENYATKSELSAVSNKLNDFLEGSDTDTIINKWKELEAFLSGMVETDNLAEILETKADKKYVDSTFVTLGTKQTITGEKTFSSVLNTAAIKASGEITTPSLAASDYVTIAGIKLRKLEDGALMLEGNLALTGALTMYASNGQSFDTIYDGLPIDNDTIYWQEVDGSRVLKAREGSGSSFDKSSMWTALAGSTTEQINKTHLTTALDNYPTKTGSGASGTWSIGITGNAATASKWATARTITLGSYLSGSVSLDGSENVMLNADVIGLTSQGNKTAVSGNTSPASGVRLYQVYNNGYPTPYGNLLSVKGGGAGELLLSWHNSNRIYYRSLRDNGDNWLGWNQLAFTTDNVASATKLQTARTLWGRSFDGTANISGDMTNVGWINNCLRINAKNNNDTTVIQGRGHSFIFGGSDLYAHVTYRFRPNYGSQGPTQSSVYIENASAATNGDPTYTTTHYFRQDGAAYHRVALGVGREATNYGIFTNTIYASDWFISEGQSGWYNQTYNGGWYMSDSNFLRSYGEKSVYIGNGSYRNAGGNVYSNNLENISEPYNCRYLSETTSGIPTGYIHPFCGWSDSTASGWITSYVIGSIRNYANNWGEMYFGIYQYEGTRRDWKAYMALDGVNRHLYINGNLMVTGGGTFYGSDIRYKSIIQQIKLSLLDIAKAPSFVYHWNKKEMICDRLNIGGSAQYTQTILPWAVEEKNNLLTMDYATVAYTFAVHTARHLLTYESRTDKKIKKLEREIVILKKQLKKLGYEEVRTLDDSGI